MKLLLFGTGDYYNRYKKWFVHQEIVALLDNSKQKQYTWIDEIRVLPPEEGVKLSYDAVVILSFYAKGNVPVLSGVLKKRRCKNVLPS